MSDFIDDTTVIEVEEKPMSSVTVETNNHALLDGLEVEDQHPVKAIIGLKDRLEAIETPKSLQTAKGKGYAEYYQWLDGNIEQEDRVRCFVTLAHDENNNIDIELINKNNYNVFGVTVEKDTTAFIGNEEWVAVINENTDTISGYESTRDYSYGLVCLVGDVKVRYWTNASEIDINPGDYVKPIIPEDGKYYGYAVKAENNDGCYRVIHAGVDLYGNYVVINLSLSATDVENINVKHAKNADNADDYTDDGTIKSKFDEVDLEIENVNEKLDQEIENIIDGTTVSGESKHTNIADNFVDGKDKEGNDIVRGIKEKFDGILGGKTSALILNAGVIKDDLNFIANGSWSPDPCGNYRSETTITINDIDINGWQLKGMWIKDDKYIQVLISEDKIFIRSLDKINEVRTHGDWTQIAGEGTSVTHAEVADEATRAIKADDADNAAHAEVADEATGYAKLSSNTFDIGAIATLGSTMTSHVIGDKMSNIGFVQGYKAFLCESGTFTENVPGTWIVCGISGESMDGKYIFYIIQRVE